MLLQTADGNHFLVFDMCVLCYGFMRRVYNAIPAQPFQLWLFECITLKSTNDFIANRIN